MADYTWILDRGTWYFLQSGGVMAADQWVLWNGNWYYLSSDGAWLETLWLRSDTGSTKTVSGVPINR